MNHFIDKYTFCSIPKLVNMLSLHGTCQSIVNVNNLTKAMISRQKCLDPELRQLISNKIKNNEEIMFLGNDVSEPTKKSDYRVYLHGITPCGTKTTLVIKGIYPYVDIMVKPRETVKQAEIRIKGYVESLSNTTDMEIVKLESFKGKNFMFFRHEQSTFIRVYFKSLSMLTSMVNSCEQRGVKTFSNSKSAYYRSVSRKYEINLAGWNVIKNYKRLTSRDYISKAEYIFEIDIDDISGIHNDEEISSTANAHGFDRSIVRFENMISASFDIEMIPHDLNDFPDAERHPKDEIFLIAITYHFAKSTDSILNVILTLKQCTPIKDAFIIHCPTESCLIAAFARCMSLMQPDFITEFNGGGFDWKNIVVKAYQKKILSTFLEDMSLVKLQTWEKRVSSVNAFVNNAWSKVMTIGRAFNVHEIKVAGAAPAKIRSLKMVGYVGFDTFVVFRQLNPNADSHKLNECLRRCNLGSKDDMDIQELFRIYKEGTAEEMRLGAHYCFIDTLKLQQLLIKKNVIQDHREIANLSYTSMSDTFMFAGGSRMRNLLMNRAEKSGYVFDTNYRPEVEDKEAKFPGAFVVPPKKGIVKPILRLDEFIEKQRELGDNSMTQSDVESGYKYIEANFDKIYHSDEEITDAPDYIKPYIDYTNKNTNQYPVSGLDYSSLYPSIIMTYNISPEKLIVDEDYANQMKELGYNLQFVSFPFCGKIVKAWFVRHDNIKENYSICGSVLIELFGMRAELKKSLFKYNKEIFELEQEMKPYIANDTIEQFPKIEEYNEIKFNQISCDSKQRAVKVFMNTLYGAMGETNSFICAIEVAASVTTMGRYNLMLARSFVVDKMQMKVYYGDSVSGDTPIMIKRNDMNEIIPIEELDDRFETYNHDKEYIDYTNENVFIKTEDGYVKITKVIRHLTDKKLYRVSTSIGSVVVTEDHSLLNTKKQKIKPSECVIGTQLLHWDNNQSSTVSPLNNQFNDNIAFVKGVFFKHGYIKDNTIVICVDDILVVNKCIRIFNNHYKNTQLVLDETCVSSGRFKIISQEICIATNCVQALPYEDARCLSCVQEWSSMFFTTRKQKMVPCDILNADNATKVSFIRGIYRSSKKQYTYLLDSVCFNLDIGGQIGTQGVYALLSDIGYNVSINIRSDIKQEYRLTFSQAKQRILNPSAIKKIEYIGNSKEYVYDLETATHHFAAGVGCMVVHNTDSLYVACNKKYFLDHDREYFTGKIDKITYAQKLVYETFKQIEVAKTGVNEHLIADNGSKHLKMAYEEVLYPVAFLSKKKYYGVPHEEKVDFYPKNLFLRGLEIVKRGSSGVLKSVINDIIREVMDIKSTNDIIDILKKAIKKFFTTKWPVEVFAKSKSYRLDKNNVSVKTMMDRYQAINYPNIPEPNVRFKTVICKYFPWEYNLNGTIYRKLSIGDRMELVERVIEENLEIDLDYYFENELTGQMARLISFCDIFTPVLKDVEYENTDDMDEVEKQAYEKTMYKKTEEMLFSAAKKYISVLAKEYNNSFTNKNKLFVDTWRTVSNTIKTRRDLYPFTRIQMNVANIFTSRDIEKIKDDMIEWVNKFIVMNHGIELSIAQKSKLDRLIEPISNYIIDNDIERDIINCEAVWIEGIIKYIYDTYEYKKICDTNLPYTCMRDVMKIPEDLEIILRDGDLYPQFTTEHASWIMDSLLLTAAKLMIGTQ